MEMAAAGDEVARAGWQQLCRVSQQHTPFTDIAFADAISQELHLPFRIALVLEGDRPRAGAILYVKRRGPYRAASHPVLAPVHSPLLDRPLSEADVHHRRSALDVLLDGIASTVHQATFALHPSLTDSRTFTWHGWRVRPAYTYRLTLDEGGSVTEGWSENPLRTLKKERSAFRIEEAPAAIDEILALVQASHDRQERVLDTPAAVIRRVATRLATAGLARPFVARNGGKTEAGAILLSDGRTAYYWAAGSRPGPGMTVLLAEALKTLRAEGVRHFDFAGANTPSIAEFKRKLGPSLVPYFQTRVSTRPELRLLDRLRWG
jgi:hypothetical protein